jgi:hypothetical protein
VAGVAVAAAAVAAPLSAQAAPAAPVANLLDAGAVGGLHARQVTQAPVHTARVHRAALPAEVLVRPGDTLWGIAGRVCDDPGAYLALAYNNDVADPNLIYAGQQFKVACQAAAQQMAARYPAPAAAPVARPLAAAAPPPAAQPSAPVAVGASGYYGCMALETLWGAEGGNPAAAFTAAEIAMAESGGNPNAVSPTSDYGLWQVNASNGALATLNPYANARSAIALSGNGTNWSAWTTFTSGAYRGRC